MKILKSSAWSVLEYVTYPIFIFLSTPYLLRTVGAENYGLWMLLIATVGLGTIANGGTGAATVKEVSSCRDKGNTTDLNTTINAALGLSLVSGSILGLIIITAFWFGSNFFFDKMGDPGLVQLVKEKITAKPKCSYYNQS